MNPSRIWLETGIIIAIVSIVLTLVGACFAAVVWAVNLTAKIDALSDIDGFKTEVSQNINDFKTEVRGEIKTLSESVDQRFSATNEQILHVIGLVTQIGLDNTQLTTNGKALFNRMQDSKIFSDYENGQIWPEDMMESKNILFTPVLTLEGLSSEERKFLETTANTTEFLLKKS